MEQACDVIPVSNRLTEQDLNDVYSTSMTRGLYSIPINHEPDTITMIIDKKEAD